MSQYTIVKDGQREEFYGAFDAGELFGWPIASVRCDAEIFPELGVDRTRRGHRETDAIDPERTTAASVCCNALALVLFAYRQLWNAGWALSYSGLIFAARITSPISRYRRRK